MIKSIIHCIEQLDGGTSFGIRQDTGESVFVPASIAKRTGLNVGDSATASLIVNVTHPEKTPWFAVFLDKTEVAPEPVHTIAHTEAVGRLLLESPGYFTTEEVAEECGISSALAFEELEQLFAKGRATRADVRTQGMNEPQFILWAGDSNNFVSMEGGQ